VNRLSYFHPLIVGSTLLTLVAQPGLASVTKITGVQLNSTPTGLELVFNTEAGDNSNVFTVSQGNILRADITRAQLNLPNGGSFRQANPAPGIKEVSVTPLDANSVRVNIQATGKAPSGTVTSYGDRVILAINNSDQPSQSATPVPAQIATVPGASVPSQPLAQNTPAPKPEVLVPNPQVTIDGKPVTRPNQVPPLLPRAVAPRWGILPSRRAEFFLTR
jgi:type IV pilus assembly protein PilQ